MEKKEIMDLWNKDWCDKCAEMIPENEPIYSTKDYNSLCEDCYVKLEQENIQKRKRVLKRW